MCPESHGRWQGCRIGKVGLVKLRYWTAFTGCAVVIASGFSLYEAPPSPPQTGITPPPAQVTSAVPAVPLSLPGAVPAPAAPALEIVWQGELGAGQTLDGLLNSAGLETAQRHTASELIGSLYDLRRLKPGFRLTVSADERKALTEIALEVENGGQIIAALGAQPSVRREMPEPEVVIRAAETEVRRSIYGALERVGAPTRFATDLELIFADVLNLRKEIGGGEQLRLVWREERIGDRVVGEPVIDFAQFDLGGETYEVIWPKDGALRNFIYRDGELLQSFRQPVPGARLSSAFGPRIHPVHGGRRMHNGVDFAAAEGTPVYAMQDGIVTFAGPRRGYGYLVEIEHGNDVVTRYGHLGPDLPVKAGGKVERGQKIAVVGNTGTSTAAHLHYEVLVQGRHVSPLDYEWPIRPQSPLADPGRLLARLEGARDHLAEALDASGGDG